MRTITINKKALHDFEIIDRFEVGIRLQGPEVKSIKNGHIDLKGSYAQFSKEGTLNLIHAYVAPYAKANSLAYTIEPLRERPLLMHRKEIIRLEGRLKQTGTTLIPLGVYSKQGIIKIELGLCRGKKIFDKRNAIKRRELDRKIRHVLRNTQ